MVLSEIQAKPKTTSRRFERKYSFFRSPDSDFGNTKTTRDSANLFHKITCSTNSPRIYPNSQKSLTIIDRSVSANHKTCLLLCDQLDTKQIIEESRRLYKVPSKPTYTKKGVSLKEQIYLGEFFKNLPRPFKMDEILRENFNTTANPNFDPNWKLSERKSGLQEALCYHLALMKNYEPEMYNFCYQAATEFNKATPLTKRPEAIISIAVHQDEGPYPCLELMCSLMEQKGIDLGKVQICIFVNGDDKDKIAQTASKIKNYIDGLSPLYSVNSPTISIVGVPINTWRFGLKAIPLNIAIMQLMLSGLLAQSDSDLPAIFLDADLYNVDNDLIKTRIDSIRDGYLITGGAHSICTINSKKYSSHINLELAKILHGSFDKTANVEIHPKPELLKNYCRAGANSAASLMALAYTGGIKPYSFFDENEWQRPIIDLFSHAFRGKKLSRKFADQYYSFGINQTTDAYKHHLLDPSQKAYVWTDAGELSRALQQGQSLDPNGLFSSHDGELGTKVRVDFKNKKLNLNRLKEDVDFFVDIMIKLMKRIGVPKRKRKRIMELSSKIYLDFSKGFLDTLEEYKKELQLIKAMLKDSFARYTKRKVRIHS